MDSVATETFGEVLTGTDLLKKQEAEVDRLRAENRHFKTEIEGLLMCGASTRNFGVSGATKTGLDAAKVILNRSTAEILSQNGPSLQIYPSEDVSKWPEHLQKKIAAGKAR